MICFHKWSKWEISKHVHTISWSGRTSPAQERRCSKCGKYVAKAIYG